MKSAPPTPAPDRNWATRAAAGAMRIVAALAASVGLSFKPAGAEPPLATQNNPPREPPRSDAQEAPAEPIPGAMHALLQGSWTPPPQLGARQPPQTATEADKKPKHDDLGFISHIDSGFNDFNDRFGGR